MTCAYVNRRGDSRSPFIRLFPRLSPQLNLDMRIDKNPGTHMILVPARGVFPSKRSPKKKREGEGDVLPVTKGSLCFQIVKGVQKSCLRVGKSSQRKEFSLCVTIQWGVFPLCGNLNCCYTLRGLCNIYERVLIK